MCALFKERDHVASIRNEANGRSRAIDDAKPSAIWSFERSEKNAARVSFKIPGGMEGRSNCGRRPEYISNGRARLRAGQLARRCCGATRDSDIRVLGKTGVITDQQIKRVFNADVGQKLRFTSGTAIRWASSADVDDSYGAFGRHANKIAADDKDRRRIRKCMRPTFGSSHSTWDATFRAFGSIDKTRRRSDNRLFTCS